MAVELMMIAEYETAEREHQLATIEHPTWERVEAAIRNMDKYARPILFLHLDPALDNDQMMEILGGPDVFWVAVSVEGFSQRRLVNPDGGNEPVEVWTSDQGFADEGRFVTRSVDQVLAVAKHFYDHKTFHPEFHWEQRSAE